MSEDIMLMESAGTLERAQHHDGLTCPDIRTGYAQNDGRQPSSMPPGPGVALTGYRLFATSVIVGIGIPKAAYSYHGEWLISPTLDWLGGMVFGVLLFWLAVIEATSPELCPRFFQVDLAPAILRCFRRRDRKTPPVPVSVSHHPTFPIPSIPATYPSTDSRDPDYGDTVTSRPYYNQPSPRTAIQGGAVAPNSSYLDMNEREVDLADFIDEDSELSLENTMGMLESGPSSIRAVGARLWAL